MTTRTATSARRILIVEDEPEIVSVYKDILSKAAGGGASAPALKSSRAKAAPKASATQAEDGSDIGTTNTGPTPPGASADASKEDGFEVVTARSGEEALKAVKAAIEENKPFAMGFFDVLLGDGIDGIETVRRIHALDKNIYAVLVTAYQDRHVDSIHAIFGKEFQDRWDYLNKPFSEGEILQKARNMVSMWNIRRREREQAASLDQLRHRLADSEKMLTVAAVARSVGHEFGNILLQIMGRADLSKNGTPEEMNKALNTILAATEHASKVLDRFKSLAKPQQSHALKKMSLAEPVRETLALMDHELRRRKVHAVVDIKDLPPIKGSSTALIQVMMNLVINALHSIKEDGRIEFHGSLQGDEVCLKIRDSGGGIPENLFDSIFEPFFTTKGDDGTGLGLPICKEIIEIVHDGRMSVRNHPEGGAEFTIAFPILEGGGDV